jgi:hypothetical protein
MTNDERLSRAFDDDKRSGNRAQKMPHRESLGFISDSEHD